MWAQLVKARLKAGKEDEMRRLDEEFQARGRGGSTGWVKDFTLRDQKDPQVYYILVYFESEEKARANERSPEQQEMYGRMQQLFDGQPEFVDLEPVSESSR